MAPSFSFESEALKAKIEWTWKKSGSCPEGTVPIRRTTKTSLREAISFEKFGRKDVSGGAVVEVSHYARKYPDYREVPKPLYGTKGAINIWNVHVEPNEWSQSLFVVGNMDGPAHSFIEAGYSDQAFSKWWLRVQGEDVGYWPESIFMSFTTCSIVKWGGEVLNKSNQQGRHTTTQMGSGKDPSCGYSKSAYMSRIQVYDKASRVYTPKYVFSETTHSRCYDEMSAHIPGRKCRPHCIQNQGLIIKSNSVRIEREELVDRRLKELNRPAKKSIQVNIAIAIGKSYHGGQVDLTVWNPFVEPDDYSTASMAFKSGPYDNFEDMEVGWMVNPKLFGDGRTRLYIHWTSDASRTTGCFNLLCPGFVQVSKKIVVGAVIEPVSQSGWEEYQISLAVFRDIMTGNWWLQYGTNELVGYWPSSIFGPLGHMAEAVQWGGDVYSPKIGKKPHTHTGMGSGQYGMDTFGACSAAHMRVRDNSPTEYRPEKLATIIDEFDCYNYKFYPRHSEDRSFYFGGPGGKDFLCQ
ncbi:hypothetical protein QJS10_CPB18g00855 [Acorus calamus]|uniref:Neprosin PEP catalytic domain-containing protein n=1 Tax=Acorus calamus TaxID=4465 RepID=A0AAV9CQ63_ACOCL|nr:hypothetical protein QJS10_CPB18g00855 [Acorus calamus]